MTFFPFILPYRYILNCIFKLICWEGTGAWMAQSLSDFSSLDFMISGSWDWASCWAPCWTWSLLDSLSSLPPVPPPPPPLPIYVVSLWAGGNLPGSIILLIKFQPPVIITNKKRFKKTFIFWAQELQVTGLNINWLVISEFHQFFQCKEKKCK